MGNLLLGLVLTVGLTSGLLVAPAAAGADNEMSKERAGRHYLTSICKTNPAIDRFDKKVWQGKKRIGRSEVARRLPQIRRESGRLAAALYREAQRLDSPPRSWPSSVESPIKKMVNNDLRESDIRYSQENAWSAGRWIRLNNQANRVYQPSLGTKIRFALDLPPRGEGC